MKRLPGLLLALCAARAARAEETPICTDRPAKANATCTVPQGRVQIETSAAGWSLTGTGAARVELVMLGSSFLKLGLSGRSDLQLGFTPYAELRIGSRPQARDSGIGDLFVRYKHRLTAAEGAVQLALIPFIKLPTAADGLGNGRIEGGLAVPVSLPLGSATLTFGPELDLLADADGSGRHLALVNLVNLAVPIAPRLTLAGEMWTNLNFDPAGTAEQASIDAALAYAVSGNVQLDAGTNVGLTADTTDFEAYLGVSWRF